MSADQVAAFGRFTGVPSPTELECRLALALRILHGKRGQLYQPYRQGQEDQLGALGLVLNMVVLWNARYLNAILNHLRGEGYPVHDDL